ncbi:InlB B-repeat-containing protein [Bifidobacterium adolescentis]|uniref:InlB B-repeat-containing protein n=1 Tax=Bifidobacterium adolescentis TaxID=1680 RepID=UPI0034A32C11
MGFLTRLLAGLVAASTLGTGLAGTANAVETNGAASDTTGAVTTTADDTGGRTVLNCRQSGEGATGPYADKFCWIDWSNLPLDSSGKPTPVRINVPGGHIDADATITHTDNAALAAKDFTGSKWSRLTSAYKLTGNTALAFSGRMGRQDPAASVTFSNVTPSADRTDTGVNVLKDFRLAFGDAEVMSGGVLQGHDVYEQTDIESDKTLEKLGMIGSGDPNQSYSKANTGYGTTHVTLAGGPKGATDDANKDSKGAAVVGAKQASRFKVSFGQVNQHWDGWGSAIAVGVYMPYLTAYPLTYDKNASDAAGEVPSNQRGKENTTQPAKTKTNGTVKTVADTNASLPDHLVNGDFNVNYHDQWKDSFGGWTSIDPNAGKTLHATSLPNGSSWKWTAINGWDKSKFGWTSTQKAGSNVQQKANAVELQYDDSTADNVYAELCAYEAGTAIYQDIRTVPGTLYKVRLKHASLNSTYLDKMQVMIGTPGHEQPVEMTRTTVNGHGDKLNEKSTTIATKVTNGNNRHHADQWETYEGTYLIPDGQTTTRFTFKSIDAKQLDYGNVLDDIVFDKAYRLSYDKNASDATGKVPSNQRGKENTVQPAKAKTTGTVRTVTDKTSDGLTVHDLEMNDVPADYRQFILNTTDTRLSQVEFEDGAWYKSTDSSSQGMWPLKLGASLTIPSVGEWNDPSGRTHQISMTMRLKDWNGGSVSELYRFDGHGNIVGDGRFWINTAYGSGYSSLPAKVEQAMGKVDTSKRVGCSWTVEFTYADTGEKVPDTFKGVTGFNDLDGWDAQSGLKFEGVQLLDGFDGAYKRSDAELGTYGTNGFAGIGHDAGDEAHLNAPQQSRHRLAATWTGSTFTFSYDLGNPAGRTDGSRMTFGAPVTRTAVLTYDKNAADAAGSVPSDTTPGTTRTVSSKTDGKVSDLVQRTTTHEDGSVTVRTVDQSTDVVSGCQVYYPAGQRITLATMAKDDDCWDSSMLSRPGHTQLGWNQDRNATQAQAEVTMVEGGMTVFAVWVGNPVLTYDTNKPSTWSGEMPSTPASVSVPYNTAAADGSGWQAGDVSKLRGYKFLGWYTGPQDNAGLYDWTRPLTGSVTVYAHWQRLQANVIYNANGGTGSHANTTGWQYSDVTVPGDTSKSFKRDGYYFKYWNTQKDGKGTTYKDGGQVPLQDKDVTLYAIWAPYHTVITETGGVGLPVLVAAGMGLLVVGIGSTVMLTRRMRGEQ